MYVCVYIYIFFFGGGGVNILPYQLHFTVCYIVDTGSTFNKHYNKYKNNIKFYFKFYFFKYIFDKKKL